MGLVGKDWHQNVMAALDLVREEVVEATRQVEKSGGAEMTRGNRILARKALDYLDNLDDFMIDVENIGEKWDGLQKKIMGDVDDVREIVLPTKFRIKQGGYIRNVKEVAPWTNFTARINDGTFIGENTAKAGFAKALACFDLEKIAKFGVVMNGEPLIAKGKSAFKKYPQAVVHIKDGWYANTNCSTARKVSLLKAFAKILGVKIELNVVPRTPSLNEPVSPLRLLPQNSNSRDKGVPTAIDIGIRNPRPLHSLVEGVPYPVGVVVQALFPEVFKRRLVTANDIAELVKTDSSKKFKTGGNSVLKINRGKDSDRYRQSKNGKSHARYYPETKVRLEFQGVKYYLTSQFAPEAIVPVVAWFAKKGIDASEICKIVEQINEMRLGGDLFANRN